MTTIVETLPKEQVAIIIKALEQRHEYLSKVAKDLEDNDYDVPQIYFHELFDLRTLMAMMHHKVDISLSLVEHENFTSKYGIDYPKHI
jgi:hypothetical protein